MKKLGALIASTIVAATLLVGCGGGKYVDGTYTGEGKGNAGTIKVEVTVEKGKIKDIELVEHHETQTLVDGVKESMFPDVIKKQGTEGVEAISGASSSSKGALEAINNALAGAAKK
ncbi:hypothetical protein JCM1393_13320 [Clostridium carnis]